MPKPDRIYNDGTQDVIVDAYEKMGKWFVYELLLNEGLTIVDSRFVGEMPKQAAEIAIENRTGIRPNLIKPKNRKP